MIKMYIVGFLLAILLSGLSYFYYLQNNIKQRDIIIETQIEKMVIKDIEKNTSMIASEAKGEIRQLERMKDVKKPSSVGTHRAIF